MTVPPPTTGPPPGITTGDAFVGLIGVATCQVIGKVQQGRCGLLVHVPGGFFPDGKPFFPRRDGDFPGKHGN